MKKITILIGLALISFGTNCAATTALVSTDQNVYRFYQKPVNDPEANVEKCDKSGTACQKYPIKWEF